MSPLELAEIVRSACLESATAAYEDAGVLGLCAEGRWEAAISAVQALDVAALVQQHALRCGLDWRA